VADTFPTDSDSPTRDRALTGARRLDARAAEEAEATHWRRLGMTAPTKEQLAQVLQAAAARREMAGLLAEQRHQFLDLDADSSCPFEGASRYPYLTLGGQS
jgi:hypothetical protein